MKKLRLIFFSMICFWMLGFASAKADDDYEITKYEVNVDILDNGDARVRQDVAYDFDGDFHGVYYNQDMRGIKGIRDVSAQVTQNGKTIELEEGNSGADNTYGIVENNAQNFKLKLYHKISDDKAVFTYGYTLKQMVTCYNDTAELNWKVIGTGWDHSLHNVKITINLPKKNIDKLQAWTHGPLDGQTKVDKKDGRVIMTLDRNPSNTFVETHMIFPKDIVPYSYNYVFKDAKKRIQRQEAKLVKEANRKREQRRRLKRLFTAFVVVLGVVYVIVAVFVSPGNKTKPERKYVHSYEIPPVTPEVAYVIDKDVSPNAQAFSAYLMRLAGERRLEIVKSDEGKKDYRIFLKDEKLLDESTVLDYLFTKIGDGTSFSIKQMKKKCKRSKVSKRLNQYFESWARTTKDQAKELNYKDKKNYAYRITFGICAVAISFLTIMAAVFETIFATLTGAGLLIVLDLVVWAAYVYYHRTHDKYTTEGRNLRYQIRCFKKMLKDIGKFDLKEVGDIILWEQILPYAVAFDLADRVIDALKFEFGEKAIEDAWGPNYVFIMSGSDFGRGFSESFSSAMSSVSSSASGGSGGFSGGSSGGVGGGSGGGAF